MLCSNDFIDSETLQTISHSQVGNVDLLHHAADMVGKLRTDHS